MAVNDITRLNNTPTLSRQGQTLTAVDPYKIEAPYTSAVLLPGVPQVGDAHPDFAGLKVDAVSFRADGAYTHADVYYSNNGRFTYEEPVDPNLPGFKSPSVSFETVELTIPSLVIRTTQVGTEPGNEVERDYWAVDPKSVRETHTTWTWRLNTDLVITGISQAFSVFDAIREQAGKLHELVPGKKFLFRPRIINEDVPGTWRVEYQWVNDPGTRNVFFGLSAPSLAPEWVSVPSVPQALAYPRVPGQEELARLPYHRIDVVPDPSDPFAVPFGVQVPIAVEDLQGYLTLPGVL